MNSEGVPGTLDELLKTLDFLHTPSFLLIVDTSGTFRFGGLNKEHESRTGLRSADLEGLTPHEALPPRMADTVEANYARCRDTRETYSYEELLDLPCGQSWWRTTLTPIIENGRVIAIVGTAVDITEFRSKLQTASDTHESLRSQAETYQTLAHASMVQMRGPLNNIISLGQMLRREIREPMSARVQLLDLMTETAVAALEEIDGFEFHLDEQPSPTAAPVAMIDFGHLCRDLSALVDPERRLSILFPEATLRSSPDDTQYVFRAIFEEAAHRARDTLSISVSDDPGRTNRIQASFRLTCRPEDRPTPAERHWLDSTLRSRRGEISIETDRARDDGLVTLVFTVFLPGHLVAAPDGSRAPREVNCRLSGRATG